MAKVDVRRMVMSGVIDLIRHKVFYGHILQQLSKVYISGIEAYAPIPTMGVGKQKEELLVKLYVNEKWVQEEIFDKAESEDQAWGWLLGVLEHETLHLVFDHLTLSFSDKLRGNVAVDLVVNSCLDKSHLPDSAMLPEMFDFEPHKSSFWYYQHLLDNDKYKDMCQNGSFGEGGIFSDAVDSHKAWESAAQDPILGEFIKDIVRKSKELCSKDFGNIPAEVVYQIGELLKTKKPIVPWGRVLRLFCASAMESTLDYTMKRISKRFGTRPGTKKEDVLNLCVAVDTSGSISEDQIKLFFNEIKWIWKNGAQVTIIECDCVIQRTYPYKGKFRGEVHGRGGTDLEPPLQEAEGHFDALVYFTDFYAPSIEHRYKIPVLWVLTTELSRDQFPYKWGKHIKIEANQAVAVS